MNVWERKLDDGEFTNNPPNSNIPTPRTDAALISWRNVKNFEEVETIEMVNSELSRQLERELINESNWHKDFQQRWNNVSANFGQYRKDKETELSLAQQRISELEKALTIYANPLLYKFIRRGDGLSEWTECRLNFDHIKGDKHKPWLAASTAITNSMRKEGTK